MVVCSSNINGIPQPLTTRITIGSPKPPVSSNINDNTTNTNDHDGDIENDNNTTSEWLKKQNHHQHLQNIKRKIDHNLNSGDNENDINGNIGAIKLENIISNLEFEI